MLYGPFNEAENSKQSFLRKMNICFISFRYPGKHNSSDFVFVKQLVDAIALRGNDCYVLSPYSISRYRRIIPKEEHYKVGYNVVTVYRPWYFGGGSIKCFRNLTKFLWRRALNKAFGRLPILPDIVYGHFWKSAYEGFHYAMSNNIPLFVATGESNISTLFKCPPDLSMFRDYVRGVICVSSKNRDESIALGLTTIEKCEVFPNAINNSLFYKRDKQELRKRLGIPSDVFVVIFVGWFVERKGPMRVAKAISRVRGEQVYSIFVGSGEQDPICDGILYKGSLPHEKVPLYLGAADAFVLPTLQEGCCNAVIEAMACGLPVISSNLPFNWDVLDDTNSIMVDPMSIEGIASAIELLRDNDELRNHLSEGALEKARTLTIDNRAAAVLHFLQMRGCR